jgi:hypothetical protein
MILATLAGENENDLDGCQAEAQLGQSAQDSSLPWIRKASFDMVLLLLRIPWAWRDRRGRDCEDIEDNRGGRAHILSGTQYTVTNVSLTAKWKEASKERAHLGAGIGV